MAKKASGGSAGEKDFGKPVDDPAKDLDTKPKNYGASTNVSSEAEEKKRGGRAKRKRGGMVHHEKGEPMKHAKHVGLVSGDKQTHAGRAPRKSGGRTGSNFSPFSSAKAGTPPRDHKVTSID